jgi:hypothetical protein
MRALSSLMLAGAVALGGLVAMPDTAAADGWRGRHYHGHAFPPPRGYYYGPRPYYAPPPPVFYRPPPAYYGPPPGFYGPRPGYYGPPRAYGIPPGPGLGFYIR